MEFKLKKYWDSWLFLTKETWGKKKGTKIYRWDGFDWSFGGKSVTLPPLAVGLFIKEKLSVIYQRDNLTLKIFLVGHKYSQKELTHLWEVSKIQNFYAQAKLSPRIYDVVTLVDSQGKKYLAQITDYISGNFPFDECNEDKVNAIGQFGFDNWINQDDLAPNNFKQGLFVDFQRFAFTPEFLERFTKRISLGLGFGDHIPYQSVETLNIPGKRNNFNRWEIFAQEFSKDKKILPKHFSVLDMGCNGGFFLRRAFENGAGYGMGVDRKEIMKIAEQISIYLGHFKGDFLDYLPERDFDMGFFLSMDAHVRPTEVLPRIKKLLYLEGHAAPEYNEKHYHKMLAPYFKTVELLGELPDELDQGKRRLLFKASNG